jgi:hypothetical protein
MNVHPRAFQPGLDMATGERLTLSGCIHVAKLCKSKA